MLSHGLCPDGHVHIGCQCLAVNASKTVYPSNSLCGVGDVYLALGSHSANRASLLMNCQKESATFLL